MKKGILGAICRFGVRLLFPTTSNVARLVTDIKAEKAKGDALKENIKAEETGE